MPGPLPLRALPVVRQGRIPTLDDDKITLSMNIPASSSSSTSSTSSPPSAPPSLSSSPPPPAISASSPSSSVIDKRTNPEGGRLVRDAMSVGVRSHAATSSTTHFSTIDFEKVIPSGSGRSSVSLISKRSKSNERRSPNRERSNSPNGHAKGYDSGGDGILCVEVIGPGSVWEYSTKRQSGKNVFHVSHAKNLSHNPLDGLMDFLRSCVVPDGYPESVSPSYGPYMQWRALKYLCGGAMSVFTTRSLLQAVGVSGHGAAPTAMAVNWVIKDGAGRVGKLLFARHGKKFDYDMKQLRFIGDLLMELGAAVELATASAPHLFLPLACAANVAKNVAAVSSTSTRAPIYKSFARGENIGDVTAKGECISNIADLLGAGLGIFISKRNPSLMATFAVLSCGYLCCSYQEIKSVCLPTLNRARFKAAVQDFLHTGKVPSVLEGNSKESIFTFPWVRKKPFALGARVNEAFKSPSKFLELLPSFQKEKYMVTYDPEKYQAFAVLKVGATSDDVLRACFHAQVLENLFQNPLAHRDYHWSLASLVNTSEPSVDAIVKGSCERVPGLFEAFKRQAISQGWVMGESLLNPGSARLAA